MNAATVLSTAPVLAAATGHAAPALPTRRVRLGRGQWATIRSVRPADLAPLRAFVAALSPVSRRNRFHGAVNGLSDGLARAMTHVVPGEIGLVLTIEAVGVETIIGEARYATAADASAEFALAIADAWQGRGLARHLLAALIDAARHAGLRWLVGDVLESNVRMLASMQRCGFVVATRRTAPGVVRIERGVAMPLRHESRPLQRALRALHGRLQRVLPAPSTARRNPATPLFAAF